jgi:probable F420-dependent oxidoreductase
MKLGLRLPQTGVNQAKKENIIHLAQEADTAGFHSLWVLERLIWPINPQDPYPGSKDGKFPHDWQYILDPIETLTFVASKTRRIKLGTSVIDMLFHNPLILSKRFTTLDFLSNGRAIAGLGIGWARDEYQAADIPFRNRGDRADEYLHLLKRIWNDCIVGFEGHYYNVPPSKIGPKPLQVPRIPIYLGGYSEKTFVRIANHADGWICTIRESLGHTKSNIQMIKKECLKANRNPGEIEIAAIIYPNIQGLNNEAGYIDPTEPRSNSQKRKNSRRLLNGHVEQLADDLRQIEEIGVDLAILNFNRSPISSNIESIIGVTRQLDKLVK